MGEIAAASTVKFDMPRASDERGVIQPDDLHRVEIRRRDHTIVTPPSNFTVVDVWKAMAYRVTATPSEDYLDVHGAIDVVKLLCDAFAGGAWQAIETPIFDALPAGLPQTSNIVLGEWRDDSWVAELRVKQALESGSDAARIAGFPEGGFLCTLVVWDDALLPR